MNRVEKKWINPYKNKHLIIKFLGSNFICFMVFLMAFIVHFGIWFLFAYLTCTTDYFSIIFLAFFSIMLSPIFVIFMDYHEFFDEKLKEIRRYEEAEDDYMNLVLNSMKRELDFIGSENMEDIYKKYNSSWPCHSSLDSIIGLAAT